MLRSTNRRQFLSCAAGSVLAGWSLSAFAQEAKPGPELKWHDVRDWGVEGRAWDDTEKYFDRFPARAKETLRPAVWNLSRHSAGMLVRFKTDATSIWADYAVTNPNLAMPHMPATGVSGLDLYAEHDGRFQWLAVTRPNAQTMNTELTSGILPGERVYGIYLPLYNGTEHLKIGIPASASFTPLEPRKEKPILFYGTSITHGACASRPGMPHPAILGRRFNLPTINLGFSGNGRMEQAVTDLIAELDPAVYVIDCLPNMGAKDVAERTQPLVTSLRKARPETPIVLVEDRTFSSAPLRPSQLAHHRASREELQKAYKALLAAGVKKLSYIDGESLLGDDHDDTTDGSHPSDLGFYRHANAMEPVIRAALGA